MTVKRIVASSLIMVATACNVATPGEFPRRGTEIDRTAKSCSKPLYCGDIGYVDCNSATDGPAYFFDRKTGRIISACGGACMVDPDGHCKTQCPPAGWACQKHISPNS